MIDDRGKGCIVYIYDTAFDIPRQMDGGLWIRDEGILMINGGWKWLIGPLYDTLLKYTLPNGILWNEGW